MLKALELAGFKSFADRTRFEFPPGITVVVGPNGSGKSNIVDAIKWVLGEQSAKSLRGGEMADVIFKGSGTSGRKALNTAEATIIFDNSEGRLAVDAPEVHVTRRVYRSGEGEYLVNREPCRLKDIRNLFRGTGVGTDAYSLIEQGKIDSLLQATPRDRRAMFEEAAGISRFKAKKVEAQRRLERVDQNLLRLSDIVEEVENRLKTVRSQATKAQRYREYSQRLQQLRTQVGLVDWRKLTEKLAAVEAAIAEIDRQFAECSAEIEALEAAGGELDSQSAEQASLLHEMEASSARCRELIASGESESEQWQARCEELSQDVTRFREQLVLLGSRAGDLQGRLKSTLQSLAAAEKQQQEVQGRLRAIEAKSAKLQEEQLAQRGRNETLAADQVRQMKELAALEMAAGEATSKQASARQSLQQDQAQQQQWRQEQVVLQQRTEGWRKERETLSRQADQAQQRLSETAEQLAALRGQQARLQEKLADARQQRTAWGERAGLLAELEKNREGLGAGVKEVLTWAKEDPAGPFGDVQGVVADLVRANVETAPLIDVALGPAAQYIVLGGDRLLEHLQSEACRVSGQVGFITLEEPSQLRQPVDLFGEPGLIGPAERSVEAEPEHRPLIQRLLGHVWFVETLSHALALAENVGRGQTFVTLAGERLSADGTLVVGPRNAAAGLISRRSELRALREEIATIDIAIAADKEQAAELSEQIAARERAEAELQSARSAAVTALAETNARLASAEERGGQLEKRLESIVSQIQQAEQAAKEAAALREELAEKHAEARQTLADTETALAVQRVLVEEIETKRQQCQREATGIQIALATSEQRMEGLLAQKSQLEHDQQERQQALDDARLQLQTARGRIGETERDILSRSGQLALLYLEKEAAAREIEACRLQQREIVKKKRRLAEELQRGRQAAEQLQGRRHEQDLAADRIRQQRETLAERLRDDYGIELASLQEVPTEEEQSQRAEVDEEIASLRRKINNIGAVNMDALNELEELENRFGGLSGQYQDLTTAKESLEKIIHKINNDSRRLFIETLEAIRANFQQLYRRAFGGGKADIVLEEGMDILEAGVEIVATPPGKPSFNNSLLSGGEKALTAVALLLAIFQFRPSPFCVLDEVDAPFDEANIGRFVEVLRDFLGWTKFVIVTHSKKTMTAATTLYGVTMQESGVSKRVSVQFEDVSEDGRISQQALEKADTPDDEQAA